MSATNEPVKLKVKVVPGASSNQLAGWLGDELKIRVSAAPEKGKANQAVVSLLADWLEVPATYIQLTAGSTSPHKVFEISGISEALLDTKLDNIK